MFCLSRSLKNFNNFRKSLTKSEQSYLNFYKCDLANFKSIDKVIKKNKKIFKNIDLLVLMDLAHIEVNILITLGQIF